MIGKAAASDVQPRLTHCCIRLVGCLHNFESAFTHTTNGTSPLRYFAIRAHRVIPLQSIEVFLAPISNRLIQPEPDWLPARHHATCNNTPTLLQWNLATFKRRRLYVRAITSGNREPFSANNAKVTTCKVLERVFAMPNGTNNMRPTKRRRFGCRQWCRSRLNPERGTLALCTLWLGSSRGRIPERFAAIWRQTRFIRRPVLATRDQVDPFLKVVADI